MGNPFPCMAGAGKQQHGVLFSNAVDSTPARFQGLLHEWQDATHGAAHTSAGGLLQQHNLRVSVTGPKARANIE